MGVIRYAGLLSVAVLLSACETATDVTSNADIVSSSPQVAADQQPRFGDWGVDLTARDTETNAGDDFYRYANGGWIDRYEIPAEKASFGAFDLLRDEAQKNVKEIILELAGSDNAPGSVEQKIGDLYSSYMNVESRNALGIQPIKNDLDYIASIDSRTELLNAFANSDLLGVNSPVGVGGGLDRKDPNSKVLYLGVGGLNLPDRDFYLQDTEQFQSIRQNYKQHIATMLGFAGYEAGKAKSAAENILALETKVAGHLLSRVELRDANKTYNPYKYAELKAAFSDVDWDNFVTTTGLDSEFANSMKWIVSAPQSVTPIVELISDDNLQTWKDYLAFTLVSDNAGLLHDELAESAFEFSKVITGQQKMNDRWRRGVRYVSGTFGEAIGEVYVRRHFPERSKQMMSELVANLRDAMKVRIDDLEWMTPETKQQAQIKLAAFNTKIGYPEKFETYPGLKITDGDLYDNVRRTRQFAREHAVAELKKPVDRSKWSMTPQTVNAYYSPLFNEIVFPAAILQAPFFDPAADPAVNYGAIGVVIGHELSHGFDDQGRKSDANGILRDWWTEEDSDQFNQRADQLVEQYNGYSPIPGHFVNGRFTLGENIGDLGGVMVAYEAYKKSLNGKPDKVIDGLTGDQRFFLSYAQIWKAKIREQRQLQLLKSGPHSPRQFRVNGIVKNVDAWYRAFDVQPGDAMYLPPEQRVRIW